MFWLRNKKIKFSLRTLKISPALRLQINRGAIFFLLNLLNKFGKREKNARLAEHFITIFCNEFDELNNTEPQMLESFEHMTLKYFGIAFQA